ncbi:holocytochrome-c synthase [Malassezia yamatoensis]|uniref:Holocytochrome c-type synthase n=1 Tax=Malassezia yamatoensis TaxID=253288 RepID=A0AAJ6CH87_9BASI|nr:holocytochrome-c synthase [Malassezia yamatoensis]
MWPFTGKASEPIKGQSACPVDHQTRNEWQAQAGCPVDHNTQTIFMEQARKPNYESNVGSESRESLSQDRVISSIPRYHMESQSSRDSAHSQANQTGDQEQNWVYPSPSQFYNAVRRKNHSANVADMDVVVPIHNAVNEQAWQMIRDWEAGWNDRSASEPQLVNFIGRPRDYTWRAYLRSLAGYQLPFDRHDWVVVRPNEENNPKTIRYIIDFYAGKADSKSASDTLTRATDPKSKISFYLDVRPAPDTVEGIAMRLHRWWLSP